MIKQIICAKKQDTWPKGNVPTEILNASNLWNCDMFKALLYVAICTRPPALHGFSLSDTWAWLRYIPAFSGDTRLRLKDEWKDIDAHQKTIMSDDLGVGCATLWLSEHLGYHYFSETRHIVDQMPSDYYSLVSDNKRGPSKSPDFMAIGKRGLAILECKGTQSNLDVLSKAMDDDHGRAQKKAFKTLSGLPPKDSLVIGLFLAQYNSSKDSTIVIADPPASTDGQETARDAEQLLRIAMTKVFLAKMFCLLNQPYNAGLILAGKARDTLDMSGRSMFEKWTMDYPHQIIHDHVWVNYATPNMGEKKATCRLSYSNKTIDALIRAENVGKLLERWSFDFNERPQIELIENLIRMNLPFGFKLELGTY